jgi:hypothetical protein
MPPSPPRRDDSEELLPHPDFQHPIRTVLVGEEVQDEGGCSRQETLTLINRAFVLLLALYLIPASHPRADKHKSTGGATETAEEEASRRAAEAKKAAEEKSAAAKATEDSNRRAKAGADSNIDSR